MQDASEWGPIHAPPLGYILTAKQLRQAKPKRKNLCIVTLTTALSFLNRLGIVSMSPVHLTIWCGVWINGAITKTTYFISHYFLRLRF